MDKDHKFYKRKKLYIAIGILILLVLIIVILAVTVFKPKYAMTTVNAIHLKDVHARLKFPRLGVDLNVSLVLDVSVKNPNPPSFKYKNSSAYLYDKGSLVGEAEIPQGQISTKEKKHLDVILTILANRLISTSGLYSDVVAGMLLFQTTNRIYGKVKVLNFRHHLVTYSFCDLSIDVWNQTLVSNVRRYKTEL